MVCEQCPLETDLLMGPTINVIPSICDIGGSVLHIPPPIIVFRDTAAIVLHDDFMTWKRVPHYMAFVMGMHRLPVDSLHEGQ